MRDILGYPLALHQRLLGLVEQLLAPDEMDEVEEFVRLARDLADEVVGFASKLLSVGTDLAHVQGRYVAVAVELLADAEAQSLLTAGGDPDALAALASVAGELAGLRDTARAESSRSGER